MPRVPSEAAAHIGRRIAAARTRLSFTQDQLAVSSGIDSSNIRSYESGRAMMSIQTLVRIAEALGTPPGEFIDELTPELFGDPTERRRPVG